MTTMTWLLFACLFLVGVAAFWPTARIRIGRSRELLGVRIAALVLGLGVVAVTVREGIVGDEIQTDATLLVALLALALGIWVLRLAAHRDDE